MEWNSSDEESEFGGFTESDIVLNEREDAGSDISLSPISSPDVSSDENDSDDDEIPNTWSENILKPKIADFDEGENPVGATFTLEKDRREIDFFMKFFPPTTD